MEEFLEVFVAQELRVAPLLSFLKLCFVNFVVENSCYLGPYALDRLKLAMDTFNAFI